MNIGDILNLKPTMDSAAGFSKPGIMPCRVIYIHPRRRFYTVEFQNDFYTWREAFSFRRVSDSDAPGKRKPEGHHAPRHYGRSI